MSALVAVLAVRLFDEAAWFVPPGTFESFRADLGLSYAQAGTVLAAAAPGAVAGTVFTVAADHVSRRALAAGGALAFAAALGAFGVADSFLVLAASSFVMGAAATSMVDAAEVALVDLAGDDLRHHLARANLLGAVGDLAGPVLLAAVAATGGSWRVACTVMAVPMAAYGVALAAVPLPPPGQAHHDDGDEDEDEDEARPASPVRAVLAVAADRRVWVMGGMAMLLGPFDEPLVAFLLALLEQERGASPAVASLVAFVGVSGGVVAYTVVARRFARVPSARLLVPAATTLALATVACAVVPVIAVVAALAFVGDVALGVLWLAVQHRTLTLRPGQVGTTKAVVSTVEMAGFAIPIAIGALADRAGLVAAVATYGFLGLALVALAAFDARRDGASVDAG